MAKSINSKQFLKLFNKNNLQQFYLFLGEEDGEKEKIIAMLQNAFLQDGDIARFHMESGDLLACGQYLLQQSMFATKKMCVLYNVEKITTKKDIAVLEEILNLSCDNLVVFTTSQNNEPAFFKKTKANVNTVIFWKMFENDLQAFALSEIKKNGKNISQDALAALTALTGRDYLKVSNAVEKIVAYNADTITPQLVVRLIADEKSVKVFDFIDSLFLGKKDALYLLSKILEDGLHELQILALINKEAERIDEYLSLVANGENCVSALDSLALTPSAKESFLKRANLFSRQKIRNIILEIAIADSNIKSSRDSSMLGTIMTNAIVNLSEKILLS